MSESTDHDAEMYPRKKFKPTKAMMEGTGKHWEQWIPDHKERWQIIAESKTAFEAIFKLETLAKSRGKK